MFALRLEEFYSYTEKNQQKKQRKQKQKKENLCTAHKHIQWPYEYPTNQL